MERRRYLERLAATGLAGAGLSGSVGLAGCIQLGAQEAGGSTGRSPTGPGRPTATDLPVPESELVRGALQDAIPAITEPAFGADWAGIRFEARTEFGEILPIEPRLHPKDEVIGLAIDGVVRAYPLRVMRWHEIVNDVVAGDPLAVTFCPLCGSSVVAEREVAGETATFGVSGWLWHSDLVMYDDVTESLWSQVIATAIRGPRTGDELALRPATRTTWEQWRTEHPDTEVLLPAPESLTVKGEVTRDVNRDPYAGYEYSAVIGLENTDFDDDRLHPKALVIGVVAGDVTRAYPFSRVKRQGLVQDTVGGLPVVVAATEDGTLVAYDRRVGGETLRFRPGPTGDLQAGGSNWRVASGRAVDGPYEGQTLEPSTPYPPMFWFAWASFAPETGVYG
ncbi:DUF3179 domain-containing protein [Haloarchaeobius sp. HME9146]|uniref:DUF3179 domain-containing protein n=1 Tax=Haloarchaeobius sp. HME9146 TaxID=2978732 RepID=UPI0021BFD530|nr:DUF3179 domain-containing protein [Haloarchaeobius sp. HME9146]MCT9096369.1 DUF3179 domain-containing protein [Haloarchaeobius sp. HME9146]